MNFDFYFGLLEVGGPMVASCPYEVIELPPGFHMDLRYDRDSGKIKVRTPDGEDNLADYLNNQSNPQARRVSSAP